MKNRIMMFLAMSVLLVSTACAAEDVCQQNRFIKLQDFKTGYYLVVQDNLDILYTHDERNATNFKRNPLSFLVTGIPTATSFYVNCYVGHQEYYIGYNYGKFFLITKENMHLELAFLLWSASFAQPDLLSLTSLEKIAISPIPHVPLLRMM